jgi:hypothetical protein
MRIWMNCAGWWISSSIEDKLAKYKRTKYKAKHSAGGLWMPAFRMNGIC